MRVLDPLPTPRTWDHPCFLAAKFCLLRENEILVGSPNVRDGNPIPLRDRKPAERVIAKAEFI
jgi:hypothetical protein